ncbi:hypothetical protein [Aphanothece sacrum]|uniref:Glycerol-3-phosphate dehydrogenase n=1 Tax=Aphanothece sacrum FPU1 TaxID=1920663 RepID=A0A401IG30_APHSA|nr:hypothetical protein [Aphanothece sacrum]GBF80243.1 glycerol-3-phosphate dehydrogenase [Aphanothece sacrum FPU1]GBF83648.1 glycerol-3-phosphate dehydrogenase [Aphanothece sacrum FPU3]
MNKNQFPSGWDEVKVHRVIEYYDTQTEDETVEEDEHIGKNLTRTLMEIPKELVPLVRDLITKYETSH